MPMILIYAWTLGPAYVEDVDLNKILQYKVNNNTETN